MSSSLSSYGTPTSYGTSSSGLLCRRRAACVKGERASWRAHAAAGEEASKIENAAPAENPQVSDPSLRSAKGFGPRRPSPPPKPPKPTPSSFVKDKKSVTSRRPAPTQPVVLPVANPVARERENVFIFGLTVVGVFIFIEGISVAASGLLPDEWDALVVKYVYPVFTPTVGLFLAGAVLYGVFKLMQGGDESDSSS